MGVAAYDPNTLIKILKFLTFIRKSIRNKEARAIREKEKNYYRSENASFSGFLTIWAKPAAPGFNHLNQTNSGVRQV